LIMHLPHMFMPHLLLMLHNYYSYLYFHSRLYVLPYTFTLHN
jgi:hypothetical protein